MLNTIKSPNFIFPNVDLNRGDVDGAVQKSFKHFISFPKLYFGESHDPTVKTKVFDNRSRSSVVSYSQPRPLMYVIPSQYLLNPDKFKIHVILFAQLRAG